MSEHPNKHRSTHTVRFSESEWNEVLAKAKKAGLRPTTYVRQAALGRRLRRRPGPRRRAELRALIDHDRQLARVGNNLNQLVHLAHAGRVRSGADFAHVLGDLRQKVDASRAEIDVAVGVLEAGS